MRKKLLRITTVPMSLRLLLTGQMRFMQESGLDVTMISSDGKEREEVIDSEGGIPHLIIPFTRKISPFKDLYCLILLIKYFLSYKPDIIHTHTPKAGLLGMLAARITKVPLRIHTIAGLPLMTADGWKKYLLILTEKLTYWSAQYILPNSHSMFTYMIGTNLCCPEKMAMIGYGSTNGIDLNRFSLTAINISELEKVKSQIKYQEDSNYLLSVGRIVRDEDIIELIESFKLVKSLEKNKKLKLILLGSIEEVRTEESLPDLVLETINDDEDIIHIQWSDQVEYFMCLADLLVHASHREGFPNVLLQGASMKCPIVCSNIPGNIDLVSHKETGLVFKKGDKDDLKEKILFAIDNIEVLKHYTDELRKIILTKFDRKFIHNQYLQFYKDKLSNSV